MNEDIPPLLEAGGKLEVCFDLFTYAFAMSFIHFDNISLCLCIRFGLLMVKPRVRYLKKILASSILGTAIWSFIPIILVIGKTSFSCAPGLERIAFR